jgi:hypothetical protein
MVAGNAIADATDIEIEYLLDYVGTSGCEFIRNGAAHSPEDAEDHLRMKYERGRKYVGNADEFIERIASQSSWTRKEYRVRCSGQPETATGLWLTQALAQYRKSDNSD